MAGEVRTRVGRTIKIVLVVGGLLAVSAVTFVAVVAWELLTSSEVRLVAGAARDQAHAAALEVSTAAKCDRLVAEARAGNKPLPACAANRSAGGTNTNAALEALVKAAVN